MRRRLRCLAPFQEHSHAAPRASPPAGQLDVAATPRMVREKVERVAAFRHSEDARGRGFAPPKL